MSRIRIVEVSDVRKSFGTSLTRSYNEAERVNPIFTILADFFDSIRIYVPKKVLIYVYSTTFDAIGGLEHVWESFVSWNSAKIVKNWFTRSALL